MQGKHAWTGHPAMSRPLTIMGVERRWFLLSATLGLAMWNAINSLLTGALMFGTLYVLGWLAWKRDPNMLAIVAGSTSAKSRYDPGKFPGWSLELT